MERSCCFTGHRPHKLPFASGSIQMTHMLDWLSAEIERLIQSDCLVFYTGMAMGVDLWCAELVLTLKERYPDVRLIGVIPFAGQSLRWPVKEQALYQKVQRELSYSIVLSQDYTPDCMQRRNAFMVDNASCVLAVSCGTKGGTANTIAYGRKRGRELILLNPKTMTVYRSPEQLTM